MGLSTHVLDTGHGCPAAGMQVTLQRSYAQGEAQTLKLLPLNADGRADEALPDAQASVQGRYRWLLAVAPCIRARGVALPDPPFIGTVQIDFGIADAASHCHVPLLVRPWSYSTYRGS